MDAEWWIDERPAGDDRPHRRSDRFDELIAFVGDADALIRLDREPLPDEAFDWSSVEPGDRPFEAVLRDGIARLDRRPMLHRRFRPWSQINVQVVEPGQTRDWRPRHQAGASSGLFRADHFV
jgi:hypothetical protein